MGVLDAQFVITASRSCPLYAVGDRFDLSGVAFSTPKNKPACLFLARVITENIVADIHPEETGGNRRPRKEFNCSGCTGVIKLAIVEEGDILPKKRQELIAEEQREEAKKIGTLASLLSSFALFQALEEDTIQDVCARLSLKKYSPDEVILMQGLPGKHLYIILSGRVKVLDTEGGSIATLGRGEIFGEMSLFSGQPVSATIKAIDAAKILLLHGKDLGHILIKHPFLQMAFTRLLVQRLAETNASRSEQFAAGVTGWLREVPASELCQMFHDNMKTGFFELDLALGSASILFIEGEIVHAKYLEKEGAEAFFSILKEKYGRFRFTSCLILEEMDTKPIGGFMNLLMEGVRRIDEENALGREGMDAEEP